MGRFHRHGVESTAAIAGHPLHHMLVVFPIAFLIGAFATDLVFWNTQDTFWAHASYYLLIAGIVTALAAAIPGFLDFFTIDRVRNLWVAWTHMIGNLIVVALAVVNVWLRWGTPLQARKAGASHCRLSRPSCSSLMGGSAANSPTGMELGRSGMKVLRSRSSIPRNHILHMPAQAEAATSEAELG